MVKLAEIVNPRQLGQRSIPQIKAAWNALHDTEKTICAVVPATTYTRLSRLLNQHRNFVLPRIILIVHLAFT